MPPPTTTTSKRSPVIAVRASARRNIVLQAIYASPVPGQVAQLWRYPVKSMGGERLRSAKVDWRGLGGDRTHAVLFDSKTGRRPLTAREADWLLSYKASYPFAPDAGLEPAEPPPAQVTVPGGSRLAYNDNRLRRGLAERFGQDVVLERDLKGLQDLGQSVLITTEASRAALETELGVPVDVRRFRPNVHLEFEAAAWDELAWEGRRLRFESGVVMQLLHPCERCAIPNRDPDAPEEHWPELIRHLAREHSTCFGINARVIIAGRIAVGQSVEIH
jgi:uncharacterized protein YcbX